MHGRFSLAALCHRRLYKENRRFVQDLKTLGFLNDISSSPVKGYYVLIGEEGKFEKMYILAEELTKTTDIKVFMLIYRVKNDENNENDNSFEDGEVDNSMLSDPVAGNARVNEMVVIEADNAFHLESKLHSVLNGLPTIDGYLILDELNSDKKAGKPNKYGIQTAMFINNSIRQKACEEKKIAIIITLLPKTGKWPQFMTESMVAREKADNRYNGCRLYIPECKKTSVNEIVCAIKTILVNKTKQAMLNMENHFYFSKKPIRKQDNKKDGIAETKFEGILKSVWIKLLGHEDISLDANIFDIGVDSFKVIQMSIDVERLGYELLLNEVYEYPTIRSLANYLTKKHIRQSCEIHSQEDFEEEFSKRAGVNCRLLISAFSTDKNILFLDNDATFGKQEAVKHIKELNAPGHLLPHYIFSLPTLDDISGVTSFDDIVERGLLVGLEIWLLKNSDEALKKALEDFYKSIISQPIIKHYDLSNIQKMMFKSRGRMQLYTIKFTEPLDESFFKQAFSDVVGSNGLLRSSLCKHMGGYKWQEHAPARSIQIPQIDISNLAPETQMQLLDIFVKKEWIRGICPVGVPMFNATLIKWNECHYELFFLFDHIIIDFTSCQIIKRQLLKRYYDLKNGIRTAMEMSLSFYKFLDQVKYGPIGIDADELITLFDLKRYNDCKLRIQKGLDKCRSRIQAIKFDIDFSSKHAEQEKELNAFELALNVSVLSLAKILDEDAVPFDLIMINRDYGKINFSNVIGPIVESIPLIIDVNRENPQEMTNTVLNRLQLINKHSISFSNMKWDIASIWRWKKLLTVAGLGKKTIRGQIVFNFVGASEQEYDEIWDRTTGLLDVRDGESLDYGDFYVLARMSGSTLSFMVLCKVASDMDQLKKVFEEEAKLLVNPVTIEI